MPKKFPPEFKRDVVRVARRGDLSIAEVAADFDISVESVRAGCARPTSTTGSRTGLTTAEQAEVVQLRRRVRRLEMENEILRRAAAYFAKDVAPKMMFPLVQDLAAEGFPVRLTCGVLGFSTQAFYKWQADPICQRDFDDAHLTNAIVDVHGDDPEFGYRFIADELERAGHEVGERRVWRLCSEHRIWSTTTKKGRRTAGKTPGPAVHDDLVQRNFTAPAPDMVWLTDITEHPTDEGKLYACCIKDVFSNRIVGYAIGDRMTADLAVRALRSAVARRQPKGTVVVHSRPGRPISFTRLPGRAQGHRPHRIDGSGRLSRRQRGDGVLLLAAPEERPRPAPLEDPRRPRLRDHLLDRAHLQPPTPSTRPRQAHPRRVRTRLHRPRR